jgi:hypothetical protein
MLHSSILSLHFEQTFLLDFRTFPILHENKLKHCVPFQEILFCQVIWPSEAGPESMEFPSILSKFQVHEVLIRRWISSQEREESDVS